MFTGVYNYKVDTKGRLSVPAPFRAAADGKFYVTCGLDKSLLVYDGNGFEEYESRLKKLNDFDRQVRALKRVFYSGAPIQGCDSHGRIKLPPALIEFAGIEKEVVLNGMSNHFEIWDKAEYDKQYQSDIENYSDNGSAMINKLDV